MPFPRFLSQCAPILVLVALITATGAQFGKLIPEQIDLLAAALGLIALAALIIYKKTPRWNFALLVPVALFAGGWLSRLPDSGRSWLGLVIFIAGAGLSAGLAYGARTSFGRLAGLLNPVLIVYLIGWAGIAFLKPVFWAPAAWAAVGALLFTLLSLGLLDEARASDPPAEPVPLAIDLFITYFNLWLAGAMVARYAEVLIPLL